MVTEIVEEDTIAAQMLKALVTRTINDITYDQMGRVIRRLQRMSRQDRGVPKRVADVLAEEIGPQKALQYVDKALAAGQITVREYEHMRAALILPMPRKEIPLPLVAKASQELLEGHQRLRADFTRLDEAGRKAFQKAFGLLDEDVKRIRKAWGLEK